MTFTTTIIENHNFAERSGEKNTVMINNYSKQVEKIMTGVYRKECFQVQRAEEIVKKKEEDKGSKKAKYASNEKLVRKFYLGTEFPEFWLQ